MHLSRLEKYPSVVNSQDVLKTLGIILITFDHISTFLVYVPIFSVLGNIGAPLFFILAGLHIPKRIFWEYLAVGILLTVVTYLTRGYWFGNILISFFFIKLILFKYPKIFARPWAGLLALVPMFLQPFNFYHFGTTFFEFGGFGISYGLSAGVRKHFRFFGTVLCLLVLSGHYAWMHVVPRSAYALPFDYKTLSFSFASTMDYFTVCIFYLVYVAMSFILISFKQRSYSISGPLKWVILVISRYSLHFYAVQLLLFSIFGR